MIFSCNNVKVKISWAMGTMHNDQFDVADFTWTRNKARIICQAQFLFFRISLESEIQLFQVFKQLVKLNYRNMDNGDQSDISWLTGSTLHSQCSTPDHTIICRCSPDKRFNDFPRNLSLSSLGFETVFTDGTIKRIPSLARDPSNSKHSING